MRTETLILENLIYNENYSSIVGIFLKPDYFKENAEKQVFIEIQKHIIVCSCYAGVSCQIMAGSWPYAQMFKLMPVVLESTLKHVSAFYNEKHNGRTLS